MPRPTSYGILGAPAGAAFDLASRVLGRNPFQSGTSSGSAGLSPELWASLNPALQNNILSVYGARGGATATGASGKTGGLAPIVFNHLGETAQRNLLQAYNKNSAAAGAANPLSSMPVPAANIPGQPAPAGTGNFLGLNPQYANYLTGWVGGGFG